MAFFTAAGVAAFLNIAATSWLAVGTAWVLNAAVGFGINIALSAVTAGMQPKFSIRGTIQGGGEIPRTFPIGLVCDAGSLVYHNTWGKPNGTPNAYFTQVIALADVPCGALQNLYVNGEKVTIEWDNLDGDFGYTITEYRKKGRDHLWVKWYDGTQTIADPLLTTKVSSVARPWQSTRVGKGVAYAVVTARISAKLYSGLPTYKFEFHGAKLYDITKDTTMGGDGPQRWNDRSTWGGDGDHLIAVQEYNLLMGQYYDGQWLLGFQNMTQYRLPPAHWRAQVAKCRAEVEGPNGMEPTYRGGGSIPFNASLADIIDALNACANGRLTEDGGLYKLHLGTPVASDLTLHEDEIITINERKYTPFFNLSNTINGITAAYPEPEESWNMKPAPPIYRSDLEIKAGNRRLLTNLQLTFCPYKSQVQRVTDATLKEAQRARKHSWTVPARFLKAEAGEVIPVTAPTEGYGEKWFRIDGKADCDNLDVVLELTEVDPEDFDWNYDDDYVPMPIVPVVPIIAPPQPTLVTFAGATIDDNDAAAKRPAISMEYAAYLDDVDYIQVQVRLDGITELMYTYDIPYGDIAADGIMRTIILNGTFARNTAHEARALFVPRTDRETEWSIWHDVTTPNVLIDIGDIDTTPPDTVVGVGMSSLAVPTDPEYAELQVNWTANTEPDLSYYILALKEDAGDWFETAVPSNTFKTRVKFNTGMQARVKAVDRVGNKSVDWSAVASHTVVTDTTPPAKVATPTATPNFGTIWFQWVPNTELDLKYYEYYISATSTPAPDAGTTPTGVTASTGIVLTGLGDSVQRFIWVRAVDTSSNKGLWSDSANATTVAGITAASIIGQITDGQIADLDAAKLIGELDGTIIAAGSIIAGKLAAKSVTVNELAVTGTFRAVNFDPNFESDNWVNKSSSGTIIEVITNPAIPGLKGNRAIINTNTMVADYVDSEKYAINYLSTYRLRLYANQFSGGDRAMYIVLRFWDRSNNPIAFSATGTWLGFSNNWYPLVLNPLTVGWNEYSTRIGNGTDKAIPSTAAFVSVGVLWNFDGTITTRQRINELSLSEMERGSLLVNGVITADHVGANLIITNTANIGDAIITSAKIVNLDGDKIDANSITAAKLDVDTLSAITGNVGELVAGVIRSADAYSFYQDLDAGLTLYGDNSVPDPEGSGTVNIREIDPASHTKIGETNSIVWNRAIEYQWSNVNRKGNTTSFYGGLAFGAGKKIAKAIVYGSGVHGFSDDVAVGNSMTLKLFGKNGTPAHATDGTELGSLVFNKQANETSGRTIVSNDLVTTYTNVWVTISYGSNVSLGIAEIKIFEVLGAQAQVIEYILPDQTLSTNTAGYGGNTVRIVVPNTIVVNSGRPYIRVKVATANTTLPITRIFIGHAASSGDAYDFASAPTQLFFGGSAGTTLASGPGAWWTDFAAFQYDATKNLIISIEIPAGTVSGRRSNAAPSGATGWKKAGADGATVNATGYSSDFYGFIFNIEQANKP